MKPKVVFLILLSLFVARTVNAQQDFPAGTVLISRNNDERLNTSPGYWNHISIATGRGTVIESQEEDGGVIETDLEIYANRDYTVDALYPIDPNVGFRAARFAETYVGQPFGQLSSFGPLRVFNRKNCVTVAKLAYIQAANRRMMFRVVIPDDIYRLEGDLLTSRPPID